VAEVLIWRLSRPVTGKNFNQARGNTILACFREPGSPASSAGATFCDRVFDRDFFRRREESVEGQMPLPPTGRRINPIALAFERISWQRNAAADLQWA